VVRSRFRSQALRELRARPVDAKHLRWEQPLVLRLGACIQRRQSLNNRLAHTEAIRQRRLVSIRCFAPLFYLWGSRDRLAGAGTSCELRGTYRRRLP